MATPSPPADFTAKLLLPLQTHNDTWDRVPVTLLQYCHSLGEAAKPVSLNAYKALSLVNMAYIGISTFDRSRLAGVRELHPEMIRKAQTAAGLDSALSTWISNITLPGLIVGTLVPALKAAASSGAAADAAVTATQNAKSWPTFVGLAVVPAVLPLTTRATDLLMDWAFRPTIQWLTEPSEAVAAPVPEYIPPMPEDIISGGLMDPGEMDPLGRARLEWALDGDASSAYPEPEDAAGFANSSAGSASSSALYASALQRVNAGTGVANKNGSTTAVDSEESYLKAVAEIRARAARRQAARAGDAASTTSPSATPEHRLQ